MNLGVFGGALPLKTKLIHCVFSGSDVRMFFYIQLQNTCIAYETLSIQLLEHGKMTGSVQLAEGGDMQIRDSTSVVMGGAWAENQNGLITEIVLGLKWMDFIIAGWLCSHTAKTFICKHHVKVNFASNVPVKIKVIVFFLTIIFALIQNLRVIFQNSRHKTVICNRLSNGQNCAYCVHIFKEALHLHWFKILIYSFSSIT